MLRLSVTEHNFISEYHPWYREPGFLARNGTAQIFYRHLGSLSLDNLDVFSLYAKTL